MATVTSSPRLQPISSSTPTSSTLGDRRRKSRLIPYHLHTLLRPSLLRTNLVLFALLLAAHTSPAIAASGGVMGGSSFSSSSSDSSSSDSHTYYYLGEPQSSTQEATDGDYVNFVAVILIVGCFVLLYNFLWGTSGKAEQIKVIKLQVCLLGMARSLQKDLDAIAIAADTSTLKGLKVMLKETALALLQNPDFCISAYSLVDVESSEKDAEGHFTRLSTEERAKFDEETLVNLNNSKWQESPQRKLKDRKSVYIVATILVAAIGVPELPFIKGISDLEKILQLLSDIPSNKLKAVQVLWTPQQEDDKLSEEELLQKYPLMTPLKDVVGETVKN